MSVSSFLKLLDRTFLYWTNQSRIKNVSEKLLFKLPMPTCKMSTRVSRALVLNDVNAIDRLLCMLPSNNHTPVLVLRGACC